MQVSSRGNPRSYGNVEAMDFNKSWKWSEWEEKILGGGKKLELTEEVERTFQEKEMVKWNDWDRK